MPNGHQHNPPQHKEGLLAGVAGGFLGAGFADLRCEWLLGMRH